MIFPDDTEAEPAVYTTADLRALERQHAAATPSLMERAGEAAARLALTLASEAGGTILVLAGPGNNGGDALAAACRLRALGVSVTVAHLGGSAPPQPRSADAGHALAAWRAGGGVLLDDVPRHRGFGLVVDGLFGIGLTRDLSGRAADWIAAAQALPCPRLALDVPSGLDSDTGCVRGCALVADHTLSFLGLKPGLLTADGPDHAGTIHLDPLGIAAPLAAGRALARLAPRHRLPPRRHNSHKGSYGHVGIVGGGRGRVGACLLAGRAALESGAGSVTLGALDERIVVDYGEPRLMFDAPETLARRRLQTLAIGPGLGQDGRAAALLESALDAPCPLVLDADALNLLADRPAWRERIAGRAAPTVLTPHPGEAARLLQTTADAIQGDRIEAARTLSRQFRAHVALKGAGTVIAHPDGRYALNTQGGPWLAQAGSGDRLTGMVAALLGQGMAAREAIEAAVWLHGAGLTPRAPAR